MATIKRAKIQDLLFLSISFYPTHQPKPSYPNPSQSYPNQPNHIQNHQFLSNTSNALYKTNTKEEDTLQEINLA